MAKIQAIPCSAYIEDGVDRSTLEEFADAVGVPTDEERELMRRYAVDLADVRWLRIHREEALAHCDPMPVEAKLLVKQIVKVPEVDRTSLLDSLAICSEWRHPLRDSPREGLPSVAQTVELEMCSHVIDVMFRLLEASNSNGSCENSEQLNDNVRGGLLEAIRVANDRVAEVAEQIAKQRDEATKGA